MSTSLLQQDSPALKSLALVAGGVTVAIAVKALIAKRRRNPRGLPLPPGPKGLPILGNVKDVPQDEAWEVYHEMCKEYGDMVYLNAMGQGILVLDSTKRNFELLEQRAINYSDRPYLAAVNMTGVDWSFAFMPYGPSWKQHRTTFHQFFKNGTLGQFHPMMYEERRELLRRMRDTPEEFIKHSELFFGGIIMRAAYGFDEKRQNESMIEKADRFLEGFGQAMKPTKYLVNVFPSFRFIPKWFPGGGYKAYFEEVAEGGSEMVDSPFELSKVNHAKGIRSVHPSMITTLLDNINGEKGRGGPMDSHLVARNVCALAYFAGADTTVASALAGIVALANNPKAQRRAQEEIDSVIGPDRLPDITDRPSLPYVHAVVKEIARWHTVTPLSIPHANTEDDEYDGHFIPKGTIIFGNSWAIMHDPEVYPEPFAFKPKRFLKDGRIDESVPDADRAAFGFGRRICPGRHFSNDELFLFVASMLSTFDIAPPTKDENGVPIPLVIKPTDGPVARPLPFRCDIKPRPGREHLVV